MARDRKRKRARVQPLVLVVGARALTTHVVAHAQDAAEERSQSFRAVQGAVKEDVPGGPLLVAAYGVVWLVLLLYLVRLVRQQQRAAADLTRLEQALNKGERRS